MRRVAVNITCPLCNLDQESVLHVLVQCHFLCLCCNKVGYMIEGGEYASFADWLSEVFQKYTGDEVKKISMVC